MPDPRQPLGPFWRLLAQLQGDRGLSDRGLGRLLGCSQAFLWKIKHGMRPPPVKTAAAWADALGLAGPQRELFLDLAAIQAADPRLLALFVRGNPAYEAVLRQLEEVAGEVPRAASDAADYHGAAPPARTVSRTAEPTAATPVRRGKRRS